VAWLSHFPTGLRVATRTRSRTFGHGLGTGPPTNYLAWRMRAIQERPGAGSNTLGRRALPRNCRANVEPSLANRTPAPRTAGSTSRPLRRGRPHHRRPRHTRASRGRRAAQQRRTRRIRGSLLPRGPCDSRLLGLGEPERVPSSVHSGTAPVRLVVVIEGVDRPSECVQKGIPPRCTSPDRLVERDEGRQTKRRTE
jgi:hypothetical protein